MEIDRVQLVKGLKVERTGSEQERRRRPQTEEDFSELLDANLEEEEEQQEQKDSEKQAKRNKDTVSITAGMPAPPLACDLVSISTTGRVGAEVDNAKRSVKNGSNDIERELKKRELHKPKPEADSGAEEKAGAAEEEQDDQHVDTLA
jgi:hypothetical protein